MRTGRVIETLGVRHAIWDGTSRLEGFPAKKLGHCVRGKKNLVAVGDEVRFRDNGDGTVLTEEVLPRRNKLSRRMTYMDTEHVIAANVDLLGVMVAPNPTINTAALDRYLAAAGAAEIPAVILCNKMDLLDRAVEEAALGPYEALGYRVYPMAALGKVGIQEFYEDLAGQWVVLLGHSGVGKTTLVNDLAPEAHMRVGEIDEESMKGRHTTTRASGFLLDNGGVIVDTAGIREFAFYHMVPAELAAAFPEIGAASEGCKFPDCRHVTEPGCAVRPEARGGAILPARYASYLKLLGEILREVPKYGKG
jgi:ribosome biogenesis GTPase